MKSLQERGASAARLDRLQFAWRQAGAVGGISRIGHPVNVRASGNP